MTQEPKKYRFSATLDAWLNNLAKTGRGKKQAVSIVADSLVVIVSLWLAYSLRHGYVFSDFRATYHLFLLMPAFTVIIFMSLGIYRWVIRSTNRRLFRQLIKGCIASALFFILVTHLLPPDRVTPRSLFALYGMLLVLGSVGIRFVWQELFDAGNRGEPMAIYGAGAAGRQLVSLLAAGHEYRPVAFIDDNVALGQSTVAGLPVFDGASDDLAAQLKRVEASRIVLAMPSISNADYQSKLRQVEKLNLPVQTVPSISELVGGTAKPDEIRDISVSDILGRTEVPPDPILIGRCVRDKVVLVTGGGGSIGSELCRQIIGLQARKLIVLDHSEENLYRITEELSTYVVAHELSENSFLPFLCSVNDKKTISALMETNGVDTVYHAAAYKHVPIIEAQPEKGVEVNVFGTLSVLDAAIENNASHFVLISTDKAVRPTNAMGASKRTAELILQAKAAESKSTTISMVRFGNVLGSSGSVVPKFKKQILEGGPITLTHPDITRYFMTIREASQLVLQAGAIAKGGDVFVLDMGKPVRIEDLAATMVHLYHKKLQRDTGNPDDIEIVVEGLRPGEKMYEELFLTGNHGDTEVAKVFTAEETWLAWSMLQPLLIELQVLASEGAQEELRRSLLNLAFSGEMKRSTGKRQPLKPDQRQHDYTESESETNKRFAAVN